jgi:hypothetical protein
MMDSEHWYIEIRFICGIRRSTDLYVHAEEADVRPLLLLEGEHGPRSVREVVQHLPRVHVSEQVSKFVT